MLDIFIQLSLMIIAALAISFIGRLLKQPIIIAYIVTGILISPFFLSVITENKIVMSFSQFGIAFLLFMVGLHLNPKVIREVGFISLAIGSIQIIFTALAGFFLAFSLLNFSLVASLYMAFALTISSTIIITKILSDKADLDTLHGKISVGILILQDMVVILLLIFLSYFSKGFEFNFMSANILYAALALASLVFASIYILPGITKFIARNQELLFLFSVAWCFLLASLFFKLGFSMEIGALLAGMSLSISPYHTEIASKVRPLRDFFIIIFFILLGLQVNLSRIPEIIKPALILSIFVIAFKFLILMTSLGIAGYSKRTGFLTSTSFGQISEFSFVMVALGVSLGHINSEVLSLVTLTGIITIASSTYMMIYSNKLFPLFSRVLSIFERKKIREGELKKRKYDFILFGYNRIGFSILKSLIKLKRNYIVVDFNPDTVKKLQERKINCVYGDAEDTEFLQSLKIDKAKFVLSTIPDPETNLLILNKIRESNEKSVVILTAHQIPDAFKFYDAGADYVITPHFLGGEYTAKIMEKFRTNKKAYKKEREKQIENLKERIGEGHEHPAVERDTQR
jgi:Kef-type K+ transport system membrane component KefB/Trk K+ transport system NAD-binding subunit